MSEPDTVFISVAQKETLARHIARRSPSPLRSLHLPQQPDLVYDVTLANVPLCAVMDRGRILTPGVMAPARVNAE